MVSASGDKTIKIWDIKNGKCKQTLIGHDDQVLSLNFSNDGRLLASGSNDKSIKIWNMISENLFMNL